MLYYKGEESVKLAYLTPENWRRSHNKALAKRAVPCHPPLTAPINGPHNEVAFLYNLSFSRSISFSASLPAPGDPPGGVTRKRRCIYRPSVIY